jgi:hypothetical protein
MKFSNIVREEWEALQPYLDTCILPVTGLTGEEQPWEATAALEYLRDLLDGIEIPYAGRTVTYPAVHYPGIDGESSNLLNQLCEGIRKTGFRFVVIVYRGNRDAEVPSADLVAAAAEGMGGDEIKEWHTQVREKIESLWKSSR